MLIVSDNDMFPMLNEKGSGRVGWDVARNSLEACGGGGTMVLQINESLRTYGDYPSLLERLRRDGWNVSLVDSMEQLVAFAQAFARMNYDHQSRQRN
jgi:hypothetical protein